MTNQEWIQTVDKSALAGFLQELTCKTCSQKGKCSGSQDIDCFASISDWLDREREERATK